jgi:hypothetical protein
VVLLIAGAVVLLIAGAVVLLIAGAVVLLIARGALAHRRHATHERVGLTERVLNAC